ncbi:nuclear transport factor 2 family protein [Cognatishimia sp. WU-CL00825]|uniref:nuclear transport factor 2 family protein n=1 Tax=Cognatishimia sp. WU-CL00825 TaxID=3127658 RepID=UPI00310B9539
MSPDSFAAITAQIETYFDALYHADSTRLRAIFHPNLAYVCATTGDEMALDLETYLARVDKRVPPAETGDARDDRILEISVGANIAQVKASMTLMQRDYLDYLTFVKHDGRWCIVAKVFEYVPRKD